MSTAEARNLIVKDDLITNANLLTVVNGSETVLHSHSGGGGAAFTSRCNVYRNAVQAITTGTWTKILLNAEDYDTDNEFDSTTDYRFQPSVTGYYHVDIAVRLESVKDAGKIACALYKNGVEYRRNDGTLGVASSAVKNISCDMYLLTTDYIELWAWHNHGSDRNASGSRTTFMSVHRFV